MRGLPLVLALLPGVLVPLAWGGTAGVRAVLALDPALLCTLAGMASGCWLLNAARLRILFGQLGTRPSRLRALRMWLVVELGLCTLPANTGGALTWSLLARRQGLTGAEGLAAYAGDQAVDLAFFALAVPAVAVYAWHAGLLPVPAPWVAVQAGGAVAALTCVGAVLKTGGGQRWHRLFARLPLPHAWHRAAHGFGGNLGLAIGRLKTLPVPVCLALLALASVHWLLRYSILYVILAGLGAPQPWAYLFMAQTATLALAQMVPVPGGAGSVEVAMAALLTARADPGTVAAALLAWRATTYHLYLLAGAVGWASLFGRSRRPGIHSSGSGHPLGGEA